MEIEELVSCIDIVDYISQFVELEERNGEYWGLSCFKDEKTPSFSVRRDPPFFYDYSSGTGGNVYSFIKQYFGCSGREAVEIMKTYAGITDEVFIPHEKLSATSVCKRFAKPKRTGKQPSGTILPDDYMVKYEWRDDKLKIWKDEGISDESLKKFGVRYDGFADRIVYPIRNLAGKIINVGGRALKDGWKERGERKYCYYFKFGTIDLIYGLFENMDAIKQAGEVIIFEGCKSVLLADTWGIHNCGAILTSHLSTNQLKILAKLGCRVVFALDNDVDITKDKNISKLKQYVNVYYIKDKSGDLLSEKDSPVDKGSDVFASLYESMVKIT